MKVTPAHFFAFLVGTIAIVAGIVAPMFQAGGSVTWQGVVSAVAAQSGLIWALFLKTILNPVSSQSAQRGFVRVRLLAFLAILGVAACGLFGVVEPPVLDCGTRVLTDAAKGMTVVQIVEDVAGPCGMDAAAVVAALLSSTDPKVTATKAYLEAKKIQAAAAGAKP